MQKSLLNLSYAQMSVFGGLLNETARYWSPFHANECVFPRNEQQKVYMFHLVGHITGFLLKGEILSIYCNITKTQGGTIKPPPPLYHGGGVTLLIRPRVKRQAIDLLPFQEVIIRNSIIPRLGSWCTNYSRF